MLGSRATGSAEKPLLFSNVDDITLEALEYGLVLRELSGLASSPAGAELIRAITPSSDLTFIETEYRALKEVVAFNGAKGALPLAGLKDVRQGLKRVKPGGYFLPPELLEIKSTVDCVISLRDLFSGRVRKDYPIASSMVDSFSTPGGISGELSAIVDEKGEIKDGATKRLFGIRQGLLSIRRSLRSLIEDMVKSKRAKTTLQDEYFTLRDDRYVLCVSAGRHAEFPGVVHGRSSSGGTYFVEPFQAVELNNKVSILKREEKEEEIEILKRITLRLLKEKDSIIKDISTAACLDSLQARSRFKNRIKGELPAIRKDGSIKLLNARHPVLVFREIAGGHKAIPVTVTLGEGVSVMVISGANAGGKTAALKTLGLLTLMACSAIPIPADASSEVVLFEKVFADIGDRQNISEDLSTFSAHLKRLKEILSLSGKSTLVLIDEIGVGTDPKEGSVLSLAALEYLKDKGAKAAVTTHLNLLKARANVDKSFQNVSVLFDEKTLSPFYTLCYGTPGASMGLKVAKIYGLPDAVVARAQEMLGTEEGVFVESIKTIEVEKEKLRTLNERLEDIEKRRSESLERLRTERGRMKSEARKKVEALVEKAKDEIDAIIKEAREKVLKTPRQRIMEEVQAASRKAMSILGHDEVEKEPSVGDNIEVIGGGAKGVVTKVSRERRLAEVSSGSLKIWLPWKSIHKSKPAHPDFSLKAAYSFESTGVPASVNLIGMRAEEALKKVEKLLDEAHLNGVEKVEIIHGLGTGRLKKAIDGYLKESSLVKGFKTAEPAQGGDGVTIVELK